MPKLEMIPPKKSLKSFFWKWIRARNLDSKQLNIFNTCAKVLCELASKWSLEIYVDHKINEMSEYSFDQVKEFSVANLEQIHDLRTTPVVIRSLCVDHIKWLKTWKGVAVVDACRKYYDKHQYALNQYDRKRKYKEIVGETVSEQAQVHVFNEHFSAEQEREALNSPKYGVQHHPPEDKKQTRNS
ncbi:hypothetical protein C1645_740706 [Glomus cerebriforme]|uniref:Uncharacterized protein n=1 Tax=Glomus cerebriforme TaxID=658196 RepID=A0A397SLV5_9GLOM|nr:hypothetical protein C1645_740706 [Glomus cerebriforme]